MVNCCSRGSPKGMASQGMQPTCCWNDSRLRSDVTKMTSNLRPVSFSRSYVFVSSGVKNLHGGHCRTEGETDARSTLSAVFVAQREKQTHGQRLQQSLSHRGRNRRTVNAFSSLCLTEGETDARSTLSAVFVAQREKQTHGQRFQQSLSHRGRNRRTVNAFSSLTSSKDANQIVQHAVQGSSLALENNT